MGYVAPTWQNGGPPALNAKNMQDISDNLAYVSNNMVNPNLLDNWYFGNPVNQRGASGTISTAGHFFDRWKLVSGSVTINSGGIVLNGTIAQVLEYAVGQTVTATVLTPDGVTDVTPVYDDETKTFTVTTQGKTIRAVKLELGTQQTLAHQENGVWGLNEIPDYGEQLRKCQRYLIDLRGWYPIIQVFGEAGSWFSIQLPCDMRANPSLITQDASRAYVMREGGFVEGVTFNWGAGVPQARTIIVQSSLVGQFADCLSIGPKAIFASAEL